MKSTIKVIGISLLAILVTILVANYVYVSGLLDFYYSELLAYNHEEDLLRNHDKDVMLIMGDSFTAGNDTYPGILRDKLPDYRVINSGISGTGVIQASFIAKRRIETYPPDVFIYQIYAGNDFMDIEYPVNWDTLSLVRNIYWFASNHIRIISFINYKSGQLRASLRKDRRRRATNSDDKFSAERFTKREKIYNLADDRLIEESVLLKGVRKRHGDILVNRLDGIFDLLPQSTKKYMIIIPHASQVSPEYLDRTISIGATIRNTEAFLAEEYPLVRALRHAFPDANVLNMLPVLRRAEKNGTRVYYANDGHLNRRGQMVVAEHIVENL